MRSALFITSAPIEKEIGNYDVYDSYDMVSRGAIAAPLIPDAQRVIERHRFPPAIREVVSIFTAESGQTLDTAKLLVNTGIVADPKIVPTPSLNGIRFSMRTLINKDEFLSSSYEESIIKARRQFVINLFQNKLEEPLESVLSRIVDMRNKIAHGRDGRVLCIAHSFYMKLVEIYFRDPTVFRSQEKLLTVFQPEKKPYSSLESFEIVV